MLLDEGSRLLLLDTSSRQLRATIITVSNLVKQMLPSRIELPGLAGELSFHHGSLALPTADRFRIVVSGKPGQKERVSPSAWRPGCAAG